MSSTADRLLQLYRDNLDTGREPDLDLGFSDSGVSSVDAVAFIKLVGTSFGVTIDPEDVSGINTLRDLANHVEAKSG